MKMVLRALATLMVFLIFLTIVVILLPEEDYENVANMTKVNSHYQEAIRLARSNYFKGYTQEALVPEDATGWILLFNRRVNLAPGGGDAYLADDIDGDATTGAIGVVSTSAESVVIARPAYRELTAETTTVTAAEELTAVTKTMKVAKELATEITTVTATSEQQFERPTGQSAAMNSNTAKMKTGNNTTPADDEMETIYESLKITNARIFGGPFSAGDVVTVAYELTNMSDTERRIPWEQRGNLA